MGAYLACTKPRAPPLAPHKLGMVHACHLNIRGVEAQGAKLQDDPHLCLVLCPHGPQEIMAKTKVESEGNN